MSTISLDRKNLKGLIQSYEKKNNLLALALFLFDYFLLCIGQYMVVEMPLGLKILGSFLSFISMVRLFILGHDACHGAFTNSKKLNYWITHLAFLPILTTYQGWSHLHNMAHHSYTNLTTTNDGWSPLSPEKYQNKTKFKKAEYKFFRSPIGVFFYYIVEVWFKYHYIPHKKIWQSYG